jgi:monoamine oxidase
MPEVDATDVLDVLVVGAGLSGAVAACRLHEAGATVAVWDARRRVGGRAWSPPVGPEGLRLDLGAAWHWREHNRVTALANRLGIARIRQHEPGTALYEPNPAQPVQRFLWPETPPPSWRLDGGTQGLVERLVDRLPERTVAFEHRVTACQRAAASVRVTAATPTGTRSAVADVVVVAVPPRLVAHTLAFDPALPPDLAEAQRAMPTWMAASGKAAARFNRPFWRAQGLDGRIVSHAGPVAHWHDAVAPDGRAALVGFLHSTGVQLLDTASEAALHTAIRAQLAHCFGGDAPAPVDLATSNWRTDPFTTPPEAAPRAPEHPPAPPAILTEPRWEGRLLWASAETAAEHPGFLDGAIEAGERAARQAQSRWATSPADA